MALSLIFASGAAASCPNEAFRTGPSANLPDCRAYELVSPPNTDGRLLNSITANGFGIAFNLFPTELASPSRDSIVYMAYASPLLQPGGPNGNYDLYEAVRGSSGWVTNRRLSPSGEQAILPKLGGVSQEHGYSFSHVEPFIGVGADRVGGSLAGEYGADYLGEPDGSFELVGLGEPGKAEPLAQGRYISPGGNHVIFSTGKLATQSTWCSRKGSGCKVEKLVSNAAPKGTGTVYDREADGPIHVVSLLPGDVPQGAGQEALYQGASKDGTSIAFKIGTTLYVRVNSGEAGEETLKAAEGDPVYAGLSDDGKYLFYVAGGENGTIHRFDTEAKIDIDVNPGGKGEVVNVSADGSHVYFISKEALTGSEQNDSGEVAVPPAKGTGTLSTAKGSGTVTAGSTTVNGVSTDEGSFEAGMGVTGNGIPFGTTIEAVGPGTLTLSDAAVESTTTSLSAGSFLVTGVSTSEGSFEAGMAITGTGIPAFTTITAVGAGTLTLSNPVTQAGSQSLSAGFPNLYAWSGGTLKYVATATASDLARTSGALGEIPALTRWTSYAVAPILGAERGPGADSSRTTPDGRVLVFESRAKLTGYENAGHTEVYRYDDEAGSLICVSCEGASEPATTDARLQEVALASPATVIHNVSDDGTRVFFETSEVLTSADTGNSNDVYQWTEGVVGPPHLISSGHSPDYPRLPGGERVEGLPRPNVLLSVTPSGNDVVFIAQEPLVPGAGEFGTEALYDARVNGGFAQPVTPRACLEEECRTKAGTNPGVLGEEKSSSQKGPGNIKPGHRKHRCHKGKGRKGGKAARRCTHGKKRHGAKKRREAELPAQSGAAGPPAASITEEPTRRQAQEPSSADAPSMRLLGSFDNFGIESLSSSLSSTAAGAHPDFTMNFSLNHIITETGVPYSDAHTEEVSVSLPPGLLGNPNAIPKCEMGAFVSFGNCPAASQVGVAHALITNFPIEVVEPIYNLTPPHPKQEVAKFGFFALSNPVYIDVKVRTASDYGVTATVHSSPSLAALLVSETILWGNPSDPSHDEERLTVKEALNCNIACEQPEGKREVPRTGLAFMTNPAECEQGDIGLQVTSYQLPGQVFSASAPLPQITNCQGLPFAPSFNATPTTPAAGAATGLSTKLILPQHLGASEPATATMREARVTLPAGMQVNPAAANWIEACSAAQIGFHQEVDANCPDGSKLGTATIKSPALPGPIQGNLYQRTPEPGHQLGLWLAVDALGLHIKLPAELEPDKKTGRLTAVFRDLPQVPVEEIDLDVWGGNRAPLINPGSCGTFQTAYTFTPHSNDPAVTGASQMTIDQGCKAPFDPKLIAGTTKPVAGKHSPLVFDLERADGDQALRGFELKLPDGLLAKIKGIGRCSEAQAGAGACPVNSKIGTVTASAGSGPDPLWVPQAGRRAPGVYLGGPHEGSPLSIVTVVPAQAGPFDLGNLVVQSGLGLDPDTNRPVIKADPLPQFFEGVGLDYRRLHVEIDRPGFVLNPTDCRVMRVNSTVTSTQGTVAHPSTRFKVTGCKRLGFKPKLSLKLAGGTERSDYPALTATLKARKGDANISRAQVSLPHSEFLAQEHIQTICTRKQFAAAKCPKGSIYGTAKVWTPLLAKPLSGPVYLRSSSHPLPDLVAALHGELDVNLVGRIDSHNGGIRTTFASVPDAPVTKFVLRMKGGKKGLLVNSTDVCAHPGRAQAGFTAQNGRAANLRPVLGFKGCGGGRGK